MSWSPGSLIPRSPLDCTPLLTTDMPTVYLIAQPSVARKPGRSGRVMPNLDALAGWGEVRTLIRAGEEPRDNPGLALKRIRSRLAEFDPSVDYLVWAGGDTLTAVLTGAVLADFATDEEEPFDAFQWLQWERVHDGKKWTDEGGCYVKKLVPLFPDNEVSVPPAYDGATPSR